MCPRIVSTDLDVSWLLSSFGEVESAGISERKMENSSLRNDAVFPPALGIEQRCKTSKPPRFTKAGQEPNGIKLTQVGVPGVIGR
jgi:hypothetical protein